MMNISKIVSKSTLCLGVLLLASVAAGLYVHHQDSDRISELESQLSVLQEQEKRSVVDRRVSKQMEEIAYGQQALSEERSQEAIRQSELAQRMTLQSEAERKRALEAQGIAEVSAQEAMNAYQMAELQRIEADNQRQQAEQAKLMTDTLNYISLGRTLGSQSYAIHQAGDTELGNMLAYASYLYTKEYGGNLYSSAIYPALTRSAGGRRSWNVHNGSVSRIYISPKDGSILTVSTYGEIFKHQMQGNLMTTDILMNDKRYCFRDVYATNNGKVYAISLTGHLVIIDGNHKHIVNLDQIDRPFRLEYTNDDKELLIIGENNIALLDLATDKMLGTRHLNYRVFCAGRRDYKPLLFDNKGRMHLVNSLDDITDEEVPVPGQVTAYASSKNEQLNAYGMSDGTIWLTDRWNNKHKLMAHLSQVTKIKVNGKRLYSSSYDGKLLFWMTGDSQIKPITLIQSGSWLTDFTFNSSKDYILTGEHNGTISEYLVSLPMMAERIEKSLKRNFTQQEWNYYVGKSIPYRKIIK
jgi:hypothetical protein